MKTSTWKNVRLKDICLEKEGLRRGPFGSAIKKEFFVPDGYKVYEQSNAIYDDVQRGKYFISQSKYRELENFKVTEGDFIVSCSGTLGRISQIPKGAKPGVINQALLRIRLKNGIVSDKYFLYYFRSSFFQKKIVEESQGTAMSNLIGIKDFKEVEIPIPEIDQQEIIVSKIEELFSELDKGIEELKTAQQQLKVYRQAVLESSFEKLDEEKTLEEVTHDYLIGIVRSNNQQNSNREGVPYIKMNNVDLDGNVDLKNVVYVKVSDAEAKKYSLVKGDILINTRNSIELVGKSGIVREDVQNVVFNNNLLRIRTREEYNPLFVLYQLISPSLLQQMRMGKKSTTNVCALYQRDIFPLRVKATSLEMQQQIVQEIESRLSVCDKIEETIADSLKQAEALRQSILKKAFEGKL